MPKKPSKGRRKKPARINTKAPKNPMYEWHPLSDADKNEAYRLAADLESGVCDSADKAALSDRSDKGRATAFMSIKMMIDSIRIKLSTTHKDRYEYSPKNDDPSSPCHPFSVTVDSDSYWKGKASALHAAISCVDEGIMISAMYYLTSQRNMSVYMRIYEAVDYRRVRYANVVARKCGIDADHCPFNGNEDVDRAKEAARRLGAFRYGIRDSEYAEAWMSSLAPSSPAIGKPLLIDEGEYSKSLKAICREFGIRS